MTQYWEPGVDYANGSVVEYQGNYYRIIQVRVDHSAIVIALLILDAHVDVPLASPFPRRLDSQCHPCTLGQDP